MLFVWGCNGLPTTPHSIYVYAFCMLCDCTSMCVNLCRVYMFIFWYMYHTFRCILHGGYTGIHRQRRQRQQHSTTINRSRLIAFNGIARNLHLAGILADWHRLWYGCGWSLWDKTPVEVPLWSLIMCVSARVFVCMYRYVSHIQKGGPRASSAIFIVHTNRIAAIICCWQMLPFEFLGLLSPRRIFAW